MNLVLTDATAAFLALAVVLALDDVSFASVLPQVDALPAIVFAVTLGLASLLLLLSCGGKGRGCEEEKGRGCEGREG